jgi:hypothetical protein
MTFDAESIARTILEQSPEDRDPLTAQLSKQVAGYLRCAIHEHGPVTHQWAGSATKRIVGGLRAWIRSRLNGEVGRRLERHVVVVKMRDDRWVVATLRRGHLEEVSTFQYEHDAYRLKEDIIETMRALAAAKS